MIQQKAKTDSKYPQSTMFCRVRLFLGKKETHVLVSDKHMNYSKNITNQLKRKYLFGLLLKYID